MSDFDNFSDIQVEDNAQSRCPVVLILDASSSMTDTLPGEERPTIDALNSGLDTLIASIAKDPIAKRRVEISCVVFGTEVSPATPFTTIDQPSIPMLVDSGLTSMGKAVEVALDAVEDRKKELKSSGIQYYRPVALLLTDGLPTDDINNAAKRVADAEQAKKISFFPVGIEGADFDTLQKINPARKPLKLQGLKFDELFQWLSASMSAVSESQPGDRVAIPAPTEWADAGWGEM